NKSFFNFGLSEAFPFLGSFHVYQFMVFLIAYCNEFLILNKIYDLNSILLDLVKDCLKLLVRYASSFSRHAWCISNGQGPTNRLATGSKALVQYSPTFSSF